MFPNLRHVLGNRSAASGCASFDVRNSRSAWASDSAALAQCSAAMRWAANMSSVLLSANGKHRAVHPNGFIRLSG